MQNQGQEKGKKIQELNRLTGDKRTEPESSSEQMLHGFARTFIF
jgi:hypothetical protein